MADSASDTLVRRLAGTGESERKQVVLETVLAEVASVLGHSSAEAIDPERTLLEIGFDSLTALNLRNRLNTIGGLQLPATIVLDHPSPAALAGHMHDLLGADGNAGRSGSTSQIGDLLHTARDRGLINEFIGLLVLTAKFRPSFDVPPALEEAPKPVPLRRAAAGPDGSTGLTLFCLPSVVAMSGPHQYARLAAGFDGECGVTALAFSGFVGGEPLPATFDVAVDTHVDAIAHHNEGASFAVVGYSSGALFAYAVASRLEQIGRAPAAMILLDAFKPSYDGMDSFTVVIDSMLEQGEAFGSVNDDRLTAMGAYLGLLTETKLTEIAAPTLLVRASQPIPGISADGYWQANWEFPHSVVDVPGDHFTIVEDHADSTARAVQDWLTIFD